MKLIVEYQWAVPYSAYGKDVIGLEYESVEKFNFDLELHIETALLSNAKNTYPLNGEFVFAGIKMEHRPII